MTAEKKPKLPRMDRRKIIAALQGAIVVMDCYFEEHDRGAFNNDNYCRATDCLKDLQKKAEGSEVL